MALCKVGFFVFYMGEGGITEVFVFFGREFDGFHVGRIAHGGVEEGGFFVDEVVFESVFGEEVVEGFFGWDGGDTVET